jgi:hypothetical protein
MKNIFFVVCDNGLGHLERVLNYIIAINKKNNFFYHIACTKSQYLTYQKINKINPRIKKKIKFHLNLFKSTVSLNTLKKKQSYDWLKKIKNNKDFYNADLVISDNLTQVLTLRSDVVLSGSFLWSSVFDEKYNKNIFYKKFCIEERKILKKYKPYMLVVKKVAMFNISKYIKQVLINWVNNDSFSIKKNKKKLFYKSIKLGFFAGNTGSQDKKIIDFIKKFLTHTKNYKIYLPYNLYKFFSKNRNCKPFLFKEYQYQNLSLAVCRPGLGTVQRLISRKIPMFVVNEKNNYEINNNCKKLVENKLAIKINLNNVDFFLRKIKNAKNLINLYKSYNKEQTNGAYQAAQWIVNKINEQ